MYGAWHAGLAAVPVNAKLHAKEHAYSLEHSGAQACIASPDLAEAIAAVRAEAPALQHLIVTGSDGYAALLDGPPAPLAATAPAELAWLFYRSEESRVGKECVSKGRSWWSPEH